MAATEKHCECHNAGVDAGAQSEVTFQAPAPARVATIGRHLGTGSPRSTLQSKDHHHGSSRRNLAASSPAPKKIWYAPNKTQAYGDEERAAVAHCLAEHCWLGGDGGPCVAEFERRICELFGKALGVFVNSGSSANELGAQILAMHLGLKEGDEIITPAITFSTTVAPWERLSRDRTVGVKIIFVDAAPGRYVPSLAGVMAAVTPRTRVLMLPNLIGEKPDWAGL